MVPKQDHREPVPPAVVSHGNFFDPALPIPRGVDLVIGNPPWVGRGQPTDQIGLAWCLSPDNPFLHQMPNVKGDRRTSFMPQEQIAHAFMWKAPVHLNPGGRACLLVTSKVLLNNTTNRFQEAWFSNFAVDRIVQLSDLRFILFENATSPALIVRYSPRKPDTEHSLIHYDVPKTSHEDPRRGVISVLPDDRKTIRLSELLRHAQDRLANLVWKKNFWGTPRDVRLIGRLSSLPPLSAIVGKPREQKRWVHGQGFKPFHDKSHKRMGKAYGREKRAWWSKRQLDLDARRQFFQLVVLEQHCSPIGSRFRKLHRSPDRRVFSSPMVLANKGFSKAAYCDFDVVFQDAIHSICGPPSDCELLMFLAAVLNSDLGRYFQFHTSANFGIERSQVQPHEILRLPFPLPECTSDPERSRSIITHTATHMRSLQRSLRDPTHQPSAVIKQTLEQISPLVYEYYEISERDQMLMEDTVGIFMPSCTPSSPRAEIPTLKPTTRPDRELYSDLLCSVLNSWAKRGSTRVNGRALVSRPLGLALFTLSKSPTPVPYKESRAPSELHRALARLARALPAPKARLTQLRGLKVFERDRLHILKPLALRHWTRTAALNDADDIATAILSAGRTTE